MAPLLSGQWRATPGSPCCAGGAALPGSMSEPTGTTISLWNEARCREQTLPCCVRMTPWGASIFLFFSKNTFFGNPGVYIKYPLLLFVGPLVFKKRMCLPVQCAIYIASVEPTFDHMVDRTTAMSERRRENSRGGMIMHSHDLCCGNSATCCVL